MMAGQLALLRREHADWIERREDALVVFPADRRRPVLNGGIIVAERFRAAALHHRPRVPDHDPAGSS